MEIFVLLKFVILLSSLTNETTCFSDAQYWEEFLPLTFTRPIVDMRVGILTFKERWEKKLLGFDESFFVTEKYLQVKYPEPEKKNLY